MNNDGDDACTLPHRPMEVPTAEAFLGRRATGLVGSQVDTVFYCTGTPNLYSHRSRVSERWGEPGYGGNFALELERREGRDSLEIMIDFCHRHGMEIFWSIRMNDTHDVMYANHMSQWKTEHPAYWMGKPEDQFPYGGGRWTALNYEVAEVRERIFAILEDVCTRYDVDGVELDFYRHPVFFRPQMTGDSVTQAQCDLMTELLRRARGMTERVAADRGRPVLVAVRVPDSMGYARAIGLDVLAWLRQDLVDLLIGPCYNHFEPWENFVALGRSFDVPVYACLSGSRLVDPAYPETPSPLQVWRDEAYNAWRAGVNGIYIFNRFDPRDPIFRELGSPETLPVHRDGFRFNWGFGTELDYWLKDGKRFLTVKD